MNLFTILSAVSSIASLLSIFFEFPDRIPISYKKFIFILSSVCFFFLLAASAIDKYDEKHDDNGDRISVTAQNSVSSESTNDGDAEIPDNSVGLADEDTVSEDPSYHDPEPEEVNEISDEEVIEVEKINDKECVIDAVQDAFVEFPSTRILEYKGEIKTADQMNTYEYTPKVSGTHRFEFSNVPNGTDLGLEICNSGGERIENDYDMDNGDGLTVSLSANKLYYINVKQYRNFGSYVLNVGRQKKTREITDYTAVSDSIQYTDQENNYSFVAENDGTYRFELSDVPNGTDLEMGIYNSGWERIEADYDLDNGCGLTEKLVSGEPYYIRVKQYRGVGAYTLNIGSQKQIVDITDYTAVSDSIQYTDQKNKYSFVAENSGTYRFELSDVPNGTDLEMGIYNSGWEQIEVAYDLDNGCGLTEDLVSGELYYIGIKQYKDVGPYTLNIGTQKKTIDISDYTAVSDSIQFTEQENNYLYVPKADGAYTLEVSGLEAGKSLMLSVYNSGWEQIDVAYDLPNNDGLETTLTKGESYYIQVAQYSGTGSYTIVLNQQ